MSNFLVIHKISEFFLEMVHILVLCDRSYIHKREVDIKEDLHLSVKNDAKVGHSINYLKYLKFLFVTIRSNNEGSSYIREFKMSFGFSVS